MPFGNRTKNLSLAKQKDEQKILFFIQEKKYIRRSETKLIYEK